MKSLKKNAVLERNLEEFPCNDSCSRGKICEMFNTFTSFLNGTWIPVKSNVEILIEPFSRPYQTFVGAHFMKDPGGRKSFLS